MANKQIGIYVIPSRFSFDGEPFASTEVQVVKNRLETRFNNLAYDIPESIDDLNIQDKLKLLIDIQACYKDPERLKKNLRIDE